jgi:hypothetical protein
VLEEAVPFATDVTGGLVGGPGALIPNVTKDRFNINVQIEPNDMLFHFRSDSLVNLSAAALWLQGSNNLDGRRVPSPDFNGLQRDVHRPVPRRPRGGAAAGVAGGRRHAAAHPGRRPWPWQHGRASLPDLPRAGGTDVPAGSKQFKLKFLMYVPTADLFAQMRTAAAAQQLQQQFLGGQGDDNGLERFITATRRQNFLVPPRRHRAFPLLELTWGPIPAPRPAQRGGTCRRRDERMTAAVSLKYFMAELAVTES